MTLKFKEGDGPAFAFHAQTTDKILLAADTGRFYTLGGDKLPGGRGFRRTGAADDRLEGDAGIVALMPAPVSEKAAGRRQRRARLRRRHCGYRGRNAQGQAGRERRRRREAQGGATRDRRRDYVAAIGDNRKLVVFPLNELPEMGAGRASQIQRYRDGGLSDAITFRFEDGLSWPMGGETGRTRTEVDLTPMAGARGAAGRMPPTGFPRNNRFV
jgi:topoisomerase-4 subunit A